MGSCQPDCEQSPRFILEFVEPRLKPTGLNWVPWRKTPTRSYVNKVYWEVLVLAGCTCKEVRKARLGKLTRNDVTREALADPVGNLEVGVAPSGSFHIETERPGLCILHQPSSTGPTGGRVTLGEAVSCHGRHCHEGSSCVQSASDIPSSWEMGALVPNRASG